MNDNFHYLFWGHALFWILIFAYTAGLIIKNKRLVREIELLKDADKSEGAEGAG